MTYWKSTIILFTLLFFAAVSTIAKAAIFGQSDVVTLSSTNHIVFSGEVNEKSVAEAMVKIGKLSSQLNRSTVIYLVIESPGGSVDAGNRFIDFAKSLPQKIKPICLYCASMGYHMFQSFDERLVYAGSELMSHRIRIGGLAGQIPGEAVSRLNNILATSARMDEFVAKRVGISVEEYRKITYDELWLDGYNAVKTHHADKIAKIKCSDELINGTTEKVFMSFFGKAKVTLSNCPLISGFLDVKLGKGHSFRSVEEAVQIVRKMKRSTNLEY